MTSPVSLQIIRILILAVVSCIISFILSPIIVRALYKYKLGKQIRDDAPVYFEMHKKKSGTPTMGGVIIWLTVIIMCIGLALLSRFFDGFWGGLNFLSRSQTYLPLGAMICAALVGLADDLLGIFKKGPSGGGLSMRFKLIIYTIIAGVGAWWFWAKLGWDILYIPFFGGISLGFWFIPFFIFILVASALSANETDGLDGLLGGVSLIVFSALLVVCMVEGKYDLAAFLGVIIGSLIAFLWFNIYPARFFMGDTGAVALGIVMGVVSVITHTALLLPFFAFILVVESLSVIIQIISRKVFKKKVFKIAPIHHHFEAVGWPESKVTMRFWMISGVAAVLGLIIFFLDKFRF